MFSIYNLYINYILIMIVASLASIPSRIRSLEKTVQSLFNNVSYLHVYLNDYQDVPKFLYNPKIIIARSQDYGNNGDAGKFFWTDKISHKEGGYHFICDDDIYYTKSYITEMTEQLNKHPNCLISACGSTIPQNFTNYYNDRTTYHFHDIITETKEVDIIGTGTLAYNANKINLNPFIFKYPNMADIWLSLYAKQHNIKMLKISFKGNPRLHLKINTEYNQHETIYYHSAKLKDQSPFNTSDKQNEIVKLIVSTRI